MDAQSKVEIVLNEDEENEEEKRFNEIICYDSGDSDGESNEFGQSDTTSTKSRISSENSQKNQENTTLDVPDPGNEIELENFMKRSNAEQMRKYRAKQRRDPVRYRKYLERERMRNYKRKYEKRIHAAQKKARALGIPYVVVDPPNARRGRKPKSSAMSLVLPSDFDGFDIEDKSLWIEAHDKYGMVPPKVETKQERQPQISAVNINKLIAHPRSALQTLLPQEVNDRERISNSIKLEHDYVRHEQFLVPRDKSTKVQHSRHKRDKNELLKLQQQCRSFISKSKHSQEVEPSQRSYRGQRHYDRSDQGQRLRRNERSQRSDRGQRRNEQCHRNERVEHEDLDDLFKELAEVATVIPTMKRHASPRKSSHKKSFFQEVEPRSAGEFSLTVSMPVQPISASALKCVKVKEEPLSPVNLFISEEPNTSSSIPSDNHWQSLEKRSHNDDDDAYVNIRHSIEIKQEPINSDKDFF